MLILFLVSICIAVFHNFSNVYAQADSIVISELYPNPLSDETEWIELYNPTESQIDISGWNIFDTLNSPSNIKIIESAVIDPYSFFVIELNTPKLNNDGDTVVLKSEDSSIVDMFEYTSSQVGKSIAKVFSNPTDISDQISMQLPTKGLINTINEIDSSESPTPISTQTPIQYPLVSIVEANGCPDEISTEYATISTKSDQTIRLDEWYFLDDQKNKILLDGYELTTELKVQFNKQILNNSGDTLTLFNPKDEQVSRIASKACTITNDEPESQKLDSSPVPAATTPISTTTPQSTYKPLISNQTNPQLIKHRKLSKLLSKNISIDIEKPNTEYVEHILQQKQVSKSGIVSAIIGGTLLILSGLLL